jgi:DNA-binding NarL/FixJ family response regulator
MDVNKATLVIADDHTIFRDALRSLLAVQKEFDVVGEAADGEQAVAMVRLHQPQILLLDVAMPGTLVVLRELSQHHPSTACILLTGAIEHRQMIEALHIGARGVVMKGGDTDLLIKAMRAVVAGFYWVGNKEVTDMALYLREAGTEAPSRARSSFGLTRRETEILETITAGLGNKEIANKFSLSEDTVKHHLTNIFDKVGVSSRLELALFAINNRLIES